MIDHIIKCEISNILNLEKSLVKDSKFTYYKRYTRYIKPDKSVLKIVPKFLLWLLSDSKFGMVNSRTYSHSAELINSIKTVIKLYENFIYSDIIPDRFDIPPNKENCNSLAAKEACDYLHNLRATLNGKGNITPAAHAAHYALGRNLSDYPTYKPSNIMDMQFNKLQSLIIQNNVIGQLYSIEDYDKD